MNLRNTLKNTLLLALLIFGAYTSRAQVTLPCPPNSDFEMGNYSVWHYYVGSCCQLAGSGVIETPLNIATPPPAVYIPCSFALTGVAAGGSVALTGVDPFGGFPVVGSGNYSLRVGSTRTERFASKAIYYVHVPLTVTNYSLIYRYAVVLENPTHPTNEQPRFTVQAFDVPPGSTDSFTDGTVMPCANFYYSAPGSSGGAGSIPGFIGQVSNAFGPIVSSGCSYTSNSGVNGAAGDVYYKPWATTSINLSAYGGHTIRMEFAAGDCNQGGHFGYGYVDMTCGTFAINSIGCGDSVATVSAPSGFANYSWYDSIQLFTNPLATVLGTTQTTTFQMPITPTTYAVIMSPYAGFGCPDTLYTHIQPSNLKLKKSDDTTICNGQSATLSTGATDVALPLSYAWSPSAGLNCATCSNPVATPFAGINTYSVTVTDAAGCNLTTGINVTVDSAAATVVTAPTSCFGFADGSATVTPTSGVAPYTYSWSTVPAQTSSIATHLVIGTYSVSLVDKDGCPASSSGIIAQPPPLTMSLGGTANPPKCHNDSGSITLNGLVPGAVDTVRFLYTATGTTTTVATVGTYSVNATGSIIITGFPLVAVAALTTSTVIGMPQGIYDSITIIPTGCPYNELGPVTLTDPPPPALPYVGSNSPVCYNTQLTLNTSDVTSGIITYSWSGPNGFTSTAQTASLTATFADSGYYVVTVTVLNCTSKDSAKVIVNPNPHPNALNNSPICSGDTLKLTASLTAGEPGPASGWSWSGPGAFVSNQQNPWVLHADSTVAAGVYTVTAYLNGCDSSNTTTATIHETPLAPIVTDTNYCHGTQNVPPLSAVGDSLVWYTSQSGLNGTTVTPTPQDTVDGITTYYVSQTYLGCHSVIAPLTVGIYPYPHPFFSISDSVYCEGTYFTFNVTNANTGVDYQGVTWGFGNADSVINVNPIVHSFGAIGTTTVTANVYYKVCPDTILSHVVTVFPYPALHLGADTSICPGGEALVVGDYENSAGASWIWNTGETTNTIRIVAPGTYYEKVTIDGCTTSDTITVANDCYMNIPNVFTPNGDGVNDYFYPRQFLTKGLTTFSMNIYNRWGQLVFTTSTTDGRGWDGSFNGVPQPEGVFVYVIDATFKDGQKEHHQGNVTLLR